MRLEEIDALYSPEDRLAIEPIQGRLLYDLVKEIKAQTIVESGTARGLSTTYMAAALEDLGQGHIVTFDTENRQPKYWDKQLDRRITCIKADFVASRRQLPITIDLAFLDSNHRIEHVLKELDVVIPLLTEKGAIAFHDTTYCEGMGQCLKTYFSWRNDFHYTEDNRGSGLGIARKGANE